MTERVGNWDQPSGRHYLRSCFRLMAYKDEYED
jgi:hypothetical protein